jgi:hypothetical protein
MMSTTNNTRKRTGAIPAIIKPRRSQIFAPADHGWYVDQISTSRSLFKVETFDRSEPILDPGCGLGTILIAAREAGYKTLAADIVDRGFHGTKVQNFFKRRNAPASVVSNPDYKIAREFVEHALEIGARKVAVLFPIARICAVRAQWIYAAPLKRVWTIGPRPSMLPGANIIAGEKAGGGRVDFCWLVFEVGHVVPGEIRHLVVTAGDR